MASPCIAVSDLYNTDCDGTIQTVWREARLQVASDLWKHSGMAYDKDPGTKMPIAHDRQFDHEGSTPLSLTLMKRERGKLLNIRPYN